MGHKRAQVYVIYLPCGLEQFCISTAGKLTISFAFGMGVMYVLYTRELWQTETLGVFALVVAKLLVFL